MGIRQMLSFCLLRGSFVLIVEKGVVVLSRGKHAKRFHAFFVFKKLEIVRLLQGLISLIRMPHGKN